MINRAQFSHPSCLACILQTSGPTRTTAISRSSPMNDQNYRGVISHFVGWCEINALQINASNTKAMAVDFRRKSTPPLRTTTTLVSIQGKDIETVDSYNYLGVHLKNKLDWTTNTDHWQEGPESPPPAEETEVLWSVQDLAKDLLWLCRSIRPFLCSRSAGKVDAPTGTKEE